MLKKIVTSDRILYILVFLISIIVFDVAFGIKALNPSNVNWMLNVYHDWGQHYLGWSFYRYDEWRFPLGDMYNFYYPVGTNVGFTDSIPLMAFIFKTVSFLLPDNFQYFGFWLLLCFFLNGFYTVKILKLFNVNNVIIVLSVIFVITNPVLIFRGMHPSLCAHWLILGSFYYYLVDVDESNAISNFKKQGILFFLSATINPYFGFLISSFVVLLAAKNYFIDKKINLKQAIFLPGISIFSGLLFWILFGMIKFNEKTTNLDVGNIYGKLYSFNLNSFFNSYGYYSKFSGQLGMVNESQHEGFGYLGLGLIILVAIAALLFVYQLLLKKISRKTIIRIAPLALLCFFFLLFAITNNISLGEKVILELPSIGLFNKLGNIFRAVGRFSWAFYYFIILSSVIIIHKFKINNYVLVSAFVALISLQLYDIENVLTSRNLDFGTFKTKLDEEKWKLIVNNFDAILVYPPYSNNMVYKMDYQDLMHVALECKKPISIGYVARENVLGSNIFKDSIKHKIKAAEIDSGQLFITNSENLKDFDALLYKDKVNLKRLDNFIFIYAKGKKLKTEYVESFDNRKYTDSIKAHYKNLSNPEMRAFKGVINSEENMEQNLEFFNFNDDIIQASGWALVKGRKDNSKDSIFILLDNQKSKYTFKTNPVKREDISSLFKGKLDNSGYNTTSFVDKLPKGNYKVSILIKDQSGKYHLTTTDKNVEIGKKEFKKPISSTRKNEVADILYNLENCKVDKKIIRINGWAALKAQSSKNKTIKLVLYNQNNKYEFDTDLIIRKDVTEAFKRQQDYENSGFELKIKREDLPKGEYKIGVLIIDANSNKSGFRDLNKIINL